MSIREWKIVSNPIVLKTGYPVLGNFPKISTSIPILVLVTMPGKRLNRDIPTNKYPHTKQNFRLAKIVNVIQRE